ncbi:MAG: hypothetical protein HYT78_10605 [Deltaproteobacteria bacterium]|nr:hypothetical protein [Deltaproteobacteria bacterium]
MRYDQIIFRGTEEHEIDAFENVTEEEILSLWRSFKATGLSEDQAWHAIVTGIALDMAFRARFVGLRESLLIPLLNPLRRHTIPQDKAKPGNSLGCGHG